MEWQLSQLIVAGFNVVALFEGHKRFVRSLFFILLFNIRFPTVPGSVWI